MNNNLMDWWMNLDGSIQYIIWIITACILSLSGVTMLVSFSMLNTFSNSIFVLITSGILFTFFSFILSILFLTIIWPSLKVKKLK